jgi:hypothetical protein
MPHTFQTAAGQGLLSDGTFWCAATLVRERGYRVTVVVPRAAGVVANARRAARHLAVGVNVAITASSVIVRLETHEPP